MTMNSSLMRLVFELSVFVFILTACGRVEDSRRNTTSELRPQDMRGQHYANVRSMLVTQGWSPIPAPCSDVIICDKDVEFAYYLNENSVCGSFARGEITIKLCGRPIADGAIIESVAFSRSVASSSP